MFGFGRKSRSTKKSTRGGGKEARNKETAELEIVLEEQTATSEVIENSIVEKKKLDIPENPYTTPFPFTECPPKILTSYASSVYNANEGRLLIIEMEKEPLSYIFNLLCFVFKLLEESYEVDISSSNFCDCMGLHLQVGIIAASFPFRKLLSIELDENLASQALEKLHTSEFGKMSCPVSYKVGFFNDYVDLYKDYEILYLDCNLLGPFLDEGIILSTAFRCMRSSPSGMFLLLLTRQSPTVDFARHGFKVVLQKKYTPNGTIGSFWLCRKL